jgi:hypothetical protein
VFQDSLKSDNNTENLGTSHTSRNIVVLHAEMAQPTSKHNICSFEDESLSDISTPEEEKAIPFLRYVFPPI